MKKLTKRRLYAILCDFIDLECLYHVKILFRPARLSRAYLCVS